MKDNLDTALDFPCTRFHTGEEVELPDVIWKAKDVSSTAFYSAFCILHSAFYFNWSFDYERCILSYGYASGSPG